MFTLLFAILLILLVGAIIFLGIILSHTLRSYLETKHNYHRMKKRVQNELEKWSDTR